MAKSKISLAHPSRRLTGEFLRRPSFTSSKILSETARPIKAKNFMWRILRKEGTKVCINDPGHMTKMAAMAIEKALKIFSRARRPMILKLVTKHQGMELYKVYINHDPGMTKKKKKKKKKKNRVGLCAKFIGFGIKVSKPNHMWSIVRKGYESVYKWSRSHDQDGRHGYK